MIGNMRLSDFIQDVGRLVAYYPGLRQITGSTTATIFICQLIYWTGREIREDKFIYKTSAEIKDETGLSYDEQKTAREKLVKSGLLIEKYARLDHQMLFKVDLDVLNQLWENRKPNIPETGNAKMGNGDSPFSLIGTTEITTENTTETTKFSKNEDDSMGKYLDLLSVGTKREAEVEVILQKLEKGLRINVPRKPLWQDLAKWVAKQDITLDQWLSWFLSDDFRKKTVSNLTPDKIRLSWPQAGGQTRGGRSAPRSD
jgi:hypothetical protein